MMASREAWISCGVIWSSLNSTFNSQISGGHKTRKALLSKKASNAAQATRAICVIGLGTDVIPPQKGGQVMGVDHRPASRLYVSRRCTAANARKMSAKNTLIAANNAAAHHSPIFGLIPATPHPKPTAELKLKLSVR